MAKNNNITFPSPNVSSQKGVRITLHHALLPYTLSNSEFQNSVINSGTNSSIIVKDEGPPAGGNCCGIFAGNIY